MSIGFGPALDAEVSYRQQQARSDFNRSWRRTRRVAAAPAPHIDPAPVHTPRREQVLIPAQRTLRPAVRHERIHAHVA